MPLPIIDLRLLTFAEEKTTPKLIEQEHKRLHIDKTQHIHLDGSRDNLGG